MEIKPGSLMEWLITICSGILCCILVATAAYVLFPLPYQSIGLPGLAASVLHVLFVYPALFLLAIALIAWFKKWMLSFLIFMLSFIIALMIAVIPLVQLTVAATEYNVNVSYSSALYYERNKGDHTAIKTIAYKLEPDGKHLMLDVWPAHATTASALKPAVIKIHGGGWSHGDKSDMSGWNTWLNSLGYSVFDIQYRLTPPERWLDAICDVKSALQWVHSHADEYGVDTGRLNLMGYSAGAQLALLTAYSAGNSFLDSCCNVSPMKVAGVIDIYGPTDLKLFYNSFNKSKHTASMLEQLIGGSPEKFPDRYALISPVNYVNSNSPPTIIIHGADDKVVPVKQSELLNNALLSVGVQHEFYRLPACDHGFDFYWNGLAAQIARDKVRIFLERNSNKNYSP